MGQKKRFFLKVAVDKQTFDVLGKMARADLRSNSGMVRVLLIDEARKRGLIQDTQRVQPDGRSNA